MKPLAIYGALVLAYQIYCLVLRFLRTPVRRKHGATPIALHSDDEWAAAIARAEMLRSQKARR